MGWWVGGFGGMETKAGVGAWVKLGNTPHNKRLKSSSLTFLCMEKAENGEKR